MFLACNTASKKLKTQMNGNLCLLIVRPLAHYRKSIVGILLLNVCSIIENFKSPEL